MSIGNYFTIQDIFETKLKQKGSVFNCYSYPLETLDEAHSILENLKIKNYDATHFCYALNLADNTFKYSDDGEPSGTAGIRIFKAIQHFNLKNILVVVIRYFGGTKLGIGPLGKAYYEAAFSNLCDAVKLEKKKYIHLKITADFDFIGSIYHILSLFESKIINTAYGDSINLEIIILPKNYPLLAEGIKNCSNGKALIEKLSDLFI